MSSVLGVLSLIFWSLTLVVATKYATFIMRADNKGEGGIMALALHGSKDIENPFYLLAPGWALYPMLILSTLATVIASQAVISGAFSVSSLS